MRQFKTLNEYPVAVMCAALEVSRSGYYAWRDGPPSTRAREDERLGVAIRAAHTASRQTYGTRRVQAELHAQGFHVRRNRIGRLRRQMSLHCKQKRRFKVTTDSNHPLPVAATSCSSALKPTRRTGSG